MSEKTKTFSEIIKADYEKLDLYTSAITRAHGKSHPEVFEVRKIFEAIHAKVKEVNLDQLDLEAEFTQLRKITDNYTVPHDVCETYAAVYNMLDELDKSYHA